jgi:hypothetical protein
VLELDPREVRFKWALNGETDESGVWRTAGPGDGVPTHERIFEERWRRRFDTSRLDVPGTAALRDGQLRITAYYGESTPPAVVAWFREKYGAIAIAIE